MKPVEQNIEQRDIYNHARRMGVDAFFADMYASIYKGMEGENAEKFKAMRPNEKIAMCSNFERDCKMTLANNRDKLGAYYNALTCMYSCEVLRELELGKRATRRYRFTVTVEGWFSELINSHSTYSELLNTLATKAKEH